MVKSGKRFIAKEREENISFSTSLSIIVDTQTGVNYIMVSRSSEGVSITPLLDSDGQVVKSSKEEIDQLS